jgi:hypothetical protein
MAAVITEAAMAVAVIMEAVTAADIMAAATAQDTHRAGARVTWGLDTRAPWRSFIAAAGIRAPRLIKVAPAVASAGGSPETGMGMARATRKVMPTSARMPVEMRAYREGMVRRMALP